MGSRLRLLLLLVLRHHRRQRMVGLRQGLGLGGRPATAAYMNTGSTADAPAPATSTSAPTAATAAAAARRPLLGIAGIAGSYRRHAGGHGTVDVSSRGCGRGCRGCGRTPGKVDGSALEQVHGGGLLLLVFLHLLSVADGVLLGHLLVAGLVLGLDELPPSGYLLVEILEGDHPVRALSVLAVGLGRLLGAGADLWGQFRGRGRRRPVAAIVA